eukprot:4067416-Alexandrium_andersonii.AAC.1
MGYCFLAKDRSDTSLTVLALKDCGSRATLARPVLREGRLREGTVGQAVPGIHGLGRHRKVLLKTDNAPAVVDLRAGAAETLGLQVAAGAPLAHEPQSNYPAENAVEQLKGLAREPSCERFRRGSRGRCPWIVRRCSGSLSAPVSCWQSTWRARATVRVPRASSASPPVRAGTSSESSCTTGRGQRTWAAARTLAGGLASGSAGVGAQPPASWLRARPRSARRGRSHDAPSSNVGAARSSEAFGRPPGRGGPGPRVRTAGRRRT